MAALSADNIYIGTHMKYLLEIGAVGFNMRDDNFEVEIIRGPNCIHLNKDDLEEDNDHNFYVCFDTLGLGTGKVTAKVTAWVPDTDYPEGLRKEVQKLDLFTIKA